MGWVELVDQLCSVMAVAVSRLDRETGTKTFDDDSIGHAKQPGLLGDRRIALLNSKYSLRVILHEHKKMSGIVTKILLFFLRNISKIKNVRNRVIFLFCQEL